MTGMRATDIVRRRRERASRARQPGRRIWRALGGGTLVLLLSLALIPLFAAVAGAASMLLLTRDLPDMRVLEALPSSYQPSAPTRLVALSVPDSGEARQPLLIDEITDPRAGGGGWIALDVVPAHAVAAYLAATDPEFYAAEPSSLAAFWAGWLRGAIREPHSSVVRDLITDHLRDGAAAQPGDTRRAAQDWLLGRQLEQAHSRQQLLEWAINSHYYGHLAYGLNAAAAVYFDKSASDLSVGESAMLAALAQRPEHNPFDDPAAARLARDVVLVEMAAMGAISPEEAEVARAEPLATAAPPGSESAAPEFTRLARRELEAILGAERLLGGGWQVEVTLDPALQEQAECVSTRVTGGVGPGGAPPCPAAEGLPVATNTTINDAAVIVLNPAKGEIQAMVGDVAYTRHSTGTLARPFIYLTVLSQGYTAASAMMDVPSVYMQGGRPYSPRNPDGLYLGPLRLREALAADRAVTAAQALGWVGVDLVQETARALGLEPDGPGVRQDLTFAESGFEASLLDIGRAFATIGNGGAMVGVADDQPRPAAVRRILDAEGREVYAYEAVTQETLAPDLAYLLTDVLGDSDTRCALVECTVSLDLPDDRAVAVSSGESAAGDAWTIGYTPDSLVGVWVGREGLTGDGDSAPLWRALSQWVWAGTELADWPRPPSLRPVEVCTASGLLPSPEVRCPTMREWFVPGTEPAAFDTMTREVAINRDTGRLATIFTPLHLIERRVYTVYPPEAAVWAQRAGVEQPPAEYDTIVDVPTRSGAAELAIEPWSAVRGAWPVVGSAGGDNFAYYRLVVFPGLMPERMENLVERGETPVDAAEIAVWDTTAMADGLYTLLLTVIRGNGTFDDVAVPVMVANEE